MKEQLDEARDFIQSGIDQVKQLKRMVSETKQSLQDQKRLQYLEDYYRNKIIEDEEAEENSTKKLNFVDKKRRLQSAYRQTGPRIAGFNISNLKNVQSNLNNPHLVSGLSVGVGGAASYADQIAQKYKERGMSAQHRPRMAGRKLGGAISGTNISTGDKKLSRRRTAQPNQR